MCAATGKGRFYDDRYPNAQSEAEAAMYEAGRKELAELTKKINDQRPPSTSGNDDIHAKLDRIEAKLDRLLGGPEGR